MPVSYLSRFTDPQGFLYGYRKDEPNKPLRSRPEAIGFQKYYYSQPHPEGGYDHNRLENGLAELEADWTRVAARLSAGEPIDKDDVSYLLGFVALQKVRVPATRDLAELSLAHTVMNELRALDAVGALDPKPEGIPNILDLIDVTIDPHKSLEAMAPLIQHLGPILDSIGYRILHNETDVSFITSDNPVSYFDPSSPENVMRPYRVERPHRPMELLFPIDSRTLLWGHSNDRARFASRGLKHVRTKDMKVVRRINRITARFAYELVIASDTQHHALIKAYADVSPVLSINGDTADYVFGKRQRKPKWQPRDAGDARDGTEG